MPGEGPVAAVRDGQRDGPRRRALPGRRSGRSLSAFGFVPVEEVRPKAPGRPGDGLGVRRPAGPGDHRERLAGGPGQAGRADRSRGTRSSRSSRNVSPRHSRREAEAKRREAELARQSLRRSLYVSDIQLAQAAWDGDNRDGMRDLLEQQRPGSGDDDLRGFEWRYLRRLGSTIRVVELSDGLAFGTMSRDGTRYVSTGVFAIEEGTAQRVLSSSSG